MVTENPNHHPDSNSNNNDDDLPHQERQEAVAVFEEDQPEPKTTPPNHNVYSGPDPTATTTTTTTTTTTVSASLQPQSLLHMACIPTMQQQTTITSSCRTASSFLSVSNVLMGSSATMGVALPGNCVDDGCPTGAVASTPLLSSQPPLPWHNIDAPLSSSSSEQMVTRLRLLFILGSALELLDDEPRNDETTTGPVLHNHMPDSPAAASLSLCSSSSYCTSHRGRKRRGRRNHPHGSVTHRDNRLGSSPDDQ